MTQQVDPRNPAVHEQTAGFEFQSHGSGPGDNNTSSSSAPNNSNNSGGNVDGSLGDRWPSLLNARQVVVAFVLETVSRSKPLQEKLNIIIVRAWHVYLSYARVYPVATVSSLSWLCFVLAVVYILFANIHTCHQSNDHLGAHTPMLSLLLHLPPPHTNSPRAHHYCITLPTFIIRPYSPAC